MHINWWTLALQTINVLILVWLLARFLYKPVMKAIDARQAASDTLLAAAQAAKAEAEAQAAALRTRNDAFATEADHRRAELQLTMDAERARLLDQAKAEAAALAAQAAASSGAERSRLMTELEEKAGILAGEMAARLLQRLPPATTTDALFAALIQRITHLPDDERGRLAADAPLTIVTPAPLEDEAQARYGQALAKALPGLRQPECAVDPSLIAGFELRGPHVVVRNSWRADLDELLARLKEDGHARLG